MLRMLGVKKRLDSEEVTGGTGVLLFQIENLLEIMLIDDLTLLSCVMLTSLSFLLSKSLSLLCTHLPSYLTNPNTI